MFYWNLLKGRRLHPMIGVPADATQNLPYLAQSPGFISQNYGLVFKTYSGANSITGYLFTANNRYILGSGEAIDIYNPFATGSIAGMCAIDGLTNHMFATTSTGIINAPISVSGNRMGWTGGQGPKPLGSATNPQITFFNFMGSNYVGFGNSYGGYFDIFKPGGIFNDYSGYDAYSTLQPCNYYNGLYQINYGGGFGANYGFISLADAPLITPHYLGGNVISYSFTKSALHFSYSAPNWYGYDGVNDPTLSTSWQLIPFAFNGGDIFGFDPATGTLLSISPSIIKVGGYNFYPVYVYDSILSRVPTPKLIDPHVKNMTLNGYLNWRR